ncbi:MAG: hypothetical protein AAF799_38165 [Myxococcota bacterium]
MSERETVVTLSCRTMAACLPCVVLGCAQPELDPEVGPAPQVQPDLPEDLCVTPLSADEPYCNSSLADGPWAMSHRTSYAQGSSPLPAPAADAVSTAARQQVPGIPVVLATTAPYEDGGRAIWAAVQGFDNAIAKLDHERFEMVDIYVPAEREDDPPMIPLGLTGAYSLVDAQGRFVVARARLLSRYGDEVPGQRDSAIALQDRTTLPDAWFCTADDLVAGIGLAYDGALILVTEQGQVIAVDEGPEGLDQAGARIASINGPRCTDGTPAEELEVVSNNVAIDESGGIFVVSSTSMHRFDHRDGTLQPRWSAPYEGEGNLSPIRLGPGSGSTPSLMGTRADEDRFIILTDGQQLMHLVFMWADDIPEGWTPIAEGKDPRIACEVPIRFGDASATDSISEQSVLVRGHAAVVVNNLVTDPTLLDGIAAIQNVVTALESGVPDKQPFGIQRVDWDPEARDCVVTWENPDISIPNGIPTMSTATGLFYGIGKRDGAWGLEAVDFETGQSRGFSPTTTQCPEDYAAFGPAAAIPEVVAALQAEPQYCENSLYAATTVGPDGMIYTGTLGGITRYVPDTVGEASVESQVAGALAQADDLIGRAQQGADSQLFDATEAMQRALLQVRELGALELDEDTEATRAEVEDALVVALLTEDEAEREQALARAREVL